jgi:hypothetical protein
MVQTPLILLAEPATSDAIRRKANEVVARAEYQLDEGLSEESQTLWLMLLRTLLRPFVWLSDVMGGLPAFMQVMVIILLVIVVLALMTHIIWSIVAAARGKRRGNQTAGAGTVRESDPKELEAAAERAATKGNYLEGIRLLFRASLIRIERAQKRKLRVGITNRELIRRYRNSSLAEPLARLIDVIDRKWFGDEDCHAVDFESCLNDQLTIRQLTGAAHNALRA